MNHQDFLNRCIEIIECNPDFVFDVEPQAAVQQLESIKDLLAALPALVSFAGLIGNTALLARLLEQGSSAAEIVDALNDEVEKQARHFQALEP